MGESVAATEHDVPRVEIGDVVRGAGMSEHLGSDDGQLRSSEAAAPGPAGTIGGLSHGLWAIPKRLLGWGGFP